jgi:twitching motility protein PilI
MAKNLDLRKYQEDILVRIKDQTRSADAGVRSRLGVRAGNDLLLVGLQDVSEVLPVPEIHPVPLSRPWFLGMANVRGNLYGVSDIAQFSGQPPTAGTVTSRILLTHQKYKANAALLVSAILGLRALDQMQEQEDESRPGRWLGGRVFRDPAGETWQEIDIKTLLASPDFMKVGLG